MPDLTAYVIPPETSVIEAMFAIDKNGLGIVFMCDDGVLQATLTDGDVRRHILAGRSLDAPALSAANTKFVCVQETVSQAVCNSLMQQHGIKVLPIVNDMGIFVDVYSIAESHTVPLPLPLGLPVIIMAGGKGTRLHPYTKVLPKPLIPIGEYTITEHIMNRFLSFGCDNFTIIVNHKKNMIKAYFADEKLPYRVTFLDEREPLGTGGGLKLLDGRVSNTFFMTNCDILVFEDYTEILEYHKSRGNLLTMVCSTKNVEIPYGIIKTKEHGQITALEEKPNFSFLVNTGLYVVEPEFLNRIPPDTFIHITDIIQKCINNGEKIGMFPISDNQWSDMGQLDEMEKMQQKLNKE
jgi:dTDP-glucose pyrophosphorylase